MDIVRNTTDAVKDGVNTVEGLGGGTVDDVTRVAKGVDNVFKLTPEILRGIDRELRRAKGNVAEPIFEAIKDLRLYDWLVKNISDLFMDRPTYIRCGEQTASKATSDGMSRMQPIRTGQDDVLQGSGRRPVFPLPQSGLDVDCGYAYSGKPVYYINGMLTNKDTAIDEACKLAKQLSRPVYLLHNPTQNIIVDLDECIKDRLWPTVVPAILDRAALMIAKMLTRADGVVSHYKDVLQPNRTTRQLTHLLYHADEPISIVSHSQGCLITRNAILTTSLFRGTKRMRTRTAWVATGVPLSKAEVFPRPDKFEVLVNQGDGVAQILGTHTGPGTQGVIDSILVKNPHHEPTNNYWPRIQPDWLQF
jgi:hypothetical protein